MEVLPDPPSTPLPTPPPLAPQVEPQPAPTQPGRLTPGWRGVFAVSWAAIFLCFAAVWEASRELGLPTWWLGPTSAPRPFLLQVLPFVVSAIAASCAAWNTKRLPWIGITAALVTLAIAAGDLGGVTRLALVEGALGLSGLAASVAAVAGVQPPPLTDPAGGAPGQ